MSKGLEMGPHHGLGFPPSKTLNSPFLIMATFSSLNPDYSHVIDEDTEPLAQGHKLLSDTVGLDFQAHAVKTPCQAQVGTALCLR